MCELIKRIKLRKEVWLSRPFSTNMRRIHIKPLTSPMGYWCVNEPNCIRNSTPLSKKPYPHDLLAEKHIHCLPYIFNSWYSLQTLIENSRGEERSYYWHIWVSFPVDLMTKLRSKLTAGLRPEPNIDRLYSFQSVETPIVTWPYISKALVIIIFLRCRIESNARACDPALI